MFLIFWNAFPAKKEFGIPPAFLPRPLPRPLLRAGKEPRQGESISPDKLFRPAESALIFRIFGKKCSNFVQKTPPIPHLKSQYFIHLIQSHFFCINPTSLRILLIANMYYKTNHPIFFSAKANKIAFSLAGFAINIGASFSI